VVSGARRTGDQTRTRRPQSRPTGYYDLFVGQLAEKYYGIPGLKQQILGADTNPNQVINTNPTYLSNPDFTSEYAQASYTTNIGQTFHGAPIRVSIAPLRNGNTHAADEVIRLLDSPTQGAALLRQFHFLPSPILAGGNIHAIPLPIRCETMGTYQNP
jgi:hypothetical protein